MSREKTNRFEIEKALNKFIKEADSETIVRVFNSELNGDLTYNSEEELFEINSVDAENLGLIEY